MLCDDKSSIARFYLAIDTLSFCMMPSALPCLVTNASSVGIIITSSIGIIITVLLTTLIPLIARFLLYCVHE